MQPVNVSFSSASNMNSTDISPSPTTNLNLNPNDSTTTPSTNAARILFDTNPPNEDQFRDTTSQASSTNDGTSSRAPSPIIQLTSDQLTELLRELRATTLSPPTFVTPPKPHIDDDPYKILQLEHLASTGLTTKYDGSPVLFPSFLKKFRNAANIACWREAIMFTTDNPDGTTSSLNLLIDFTKIPEDTITAQATLRWTQPASIANLSKKGTFEFNNKLLCLFLTNSITDNLHTKLQNRAGDLLANDGQLLLWLLCQDIHHNSISYETDIKNQIRTCSMAADHNNDPQEFVTHLKNLCQLIMKDDNDKTHNDLVEPILRALQLSPFEKFNEAVEEWEIDYFGDMLTLTPATLLHKADKKLQVLRNAKKLQIKPNTELMALRAQFEAQSKQLTGAFHKIAQNLNSTPYQNFRSQGSPHNGRFSRPPRPDWFAHPPQDPNTVRTHDNRDWHWCQKCNNNNGRWVTTHHPKDHVDGYSAPRHNDNYPPPRDSRKRPYPTDTSYYQNPQHHRPRLTAQVAMHEFNFHPTTTQDNDFPWDPTVLCATTLTLYVKLKILFKKNKILSI